MSACIVVRRNDKVCSSFTIYDHDSLKQVNVKRLKNGQDACRSARSVQAGAITTVTTLAALSDVRVVVLCMKKVFVGRALRVQRGKPCDTEVRTVRREYGLVKYDRFGEIETNEIGRNVT